MNYRRNTSNNDISRQKTQPEDSQDSLAQQLSGVLKLLNPEIIEEIAESNFPD